MLAKPQCCVQAGMRTANPRLDPRTALGQVGHKFSAAARPETLPSRTCVGSCGRAAETPVRRRLLGHRDTAGGYDWRSEPFPTRMSRQRRIRPLLLASTTAIRCQGSELGRSKACTHPLCSIFRRCNSEASGLGPAMPWDCWQNLARLDWPTWNRYSEPPTFGRARRRQTMPEIRLEGCTPEPLMSYLKAIRSVPPRCGASRPERAIVMAK